MRCKSAVECGKSVAVDPARLAVGELSGSTANAGKAAQKKAKRAWNLKPRTPKDCPDCRLESQGMLLDVQRTARPWSEVKSPRGRPKTHATDGQACMKPMPIAFLHRVKAMLAANCVPVFTSNGLQQYFYGLTAHFGVWVEEEGHRQPVWHVLPRLLYGQFRKLKVGHKLKQVYTKMLCGQRADLETTLQRLGLSGKIQTAFIERLNLTLRHLVATLSRRTWALAHTVQGLRWRVALAVGYYNFCRMHHALRVPMGEGHFRGRTPAMALGVTGHCWSVREFITHPVY